MAVEWLLNVFFEWLFNGLLNASGMVVEWVLNGFGMVVEWLLNCLWNVLFVNGC